MARISSRRAVSDNSLERMERRLAGKGKSKGAFCGTSWPAVTAGVKSDVWIPEREGRRVDDRVARAAEGKHLTTEIQVRGGKDDVRKFHAVVLPIGACSKRCL